MHLFDVESDGLLDTVSKIHCLVIKDSLSGRTWRYRPDNVEKGLRKLMDISWETPTPEEIEADGPYRIGGHNVIKYDVPAIQKIFPWFKPNPAAVYDTLVVSRLIFSSLELKDSKLMRQGILPGKLFASHSLKAWGYRLGVLKGNYAAETEDAWAVFSEEMLSYCVQDVEVTAKLYELLNTAKYPLTAIELEHDTCWMIAQQERNGFPFNEKQAAIYYASLSARRAELETSLVETFGSWFEPAMKSPKVPSKDNKRFGYTAGAAYMPIKYVTFNPGSRQHISRCLKIMGWIPTEFTETGQPKVDESTLEALEFPEAKLVTEYLTIQKRIGQLAEGDNAWLKLVTPQGRIHGYVNTNGAVTGRATHSFPNLAQVPSVRLDKDGNVLWGFAGGWGAEFRGLFGVPEGWVQVGIDASGLELRCLGHFVWAFDDGQYAYIVLNGDIHTVNMEAAGLDTRGQAKTFIYAFLYGAGAQKIGSIVLPLGTAEEQKNIGKKLMKEFLKKTPGIKKLRDAIQKVLVKSSEWVGKEQKISWNRRHLIGLDGRKLHIRSPHSAPNTLLQSAGALICKKWGVETIKRLTKLGLTQGWDGDYCQLAWVHDEYQYACRTPEIAEIVKRESQLAMRDTQEFFNFKVRLDTEGKIGATWFECH